MMTPVRIQRKRTKGWRMPENTVSVTRPGPFGNPFSIAAAADIFDCRPASAHEHAAQWFRDWIGRDNDDEALSDLGAYGGTRKQHAKIHDRLHELRGKNLACFCALDRACHADVLLDLANRPFCEAVPTTPQGTATMTMTAEERAATLLKVSNLGESSNVADAIEQIAQTIRAAANRALERAAELLATWGSAAELGLRDREMTVQEARLVMAALASRKAAILALKQPAGDHPERGPR